MARSLERLKTQIKAKIPDIDRSEPQKTYKFSLFIKLVIRGKSSGSLEDPHLSREGTKKDLACGTTRNRLLVQSNPLLWPVFIWWTFMGFVDFFFIVLLNVTNLSNTNWFLITWPLNKQSKRRLSCPKCPFNTDQALFNFGHEQSKPCVTWQSPLLLTAWLVREKVAGGAAGMIQTQSQCQL